MHRADLEEFPVCQARVRVHGTFSEVCSKEITSPLCIHTLSALNITLAEILQILQVWKRIKREWGEKHSPKTREGKLIYFKTTVNVLDFALPGSEYM